MDSNPLTTLIASIKQLILTHDPLLVAIDGPGGAGKTSLARRLQGSLKRCVILQLDDFYSPELQATDVERLREQVLLPVRTQKPVHYQVFDWKENRLSDDHHLDPEGIIIFEGIYGLDRRIRGYFDLKVWIEIPPEVGFERGVARDRYQEGVDNSEKWKTFWLPREAEYRRVQEPDKCADIILDGRDFYQFNY